MKMRSACKFVATPVLLLAFASCSLLGEGSSEEEPLLEDSSDELQKKRRDAGSATDATRSDAGVVDSGASDAGTVVVDGSAPPPPPPPLPSNGSLPQGKTGLAAGYPGDLGIGGHASVVFADDFESYALPSDLGTRWDAVYQTTQIRIAKEVGTYYAGAKALELRVPQQTAELSNALDKVLTQERDVLFLRFYTKFKSPFDVVGSSHNGGMIAAHYFVNGQATPGVPADGTNKFLVALENWRETSSEPSPGFLNAYVYHPEQRSQWGDHFFPTGTVLPFSYLAGDFGPTFVARPDFVPALDRWYCFELMVKANTPGQRDGRIAAWIDGSIVADFPNLRLRDVDSLKIDRFGLMLHAKSNPSGPLLKWYDNVVAATSYIGPMQ